MKNYIGIDLGSKTIGISISTSGIIAQSLTTYRFKENDYNEAANIIVSVIEKYHITDVVIGYPKHMNNDVGLRGKISEKLKEDILKLKHVNIILWDERLSTKSALDVMIKGGQSRKKQKQKKDELAATLILQNYLDYKGDH